MKNQVTTIEQSQRLMALGVPAKKASCRWESRSANKLRNDKVVCEWSEYQLCIGFNDATNADNYRVLPAFTVADLLAMIPWEIEVKNRVLSTLPGIRLDDSESTPFRFKIRKMGVMWTCRYASYGIGKINGLFETSRAGVNLIDPLCELIEWLVPDGYELEV